MTNKINVYIHYADTRKIKIHTIAQFVRFSLLPYRPTFKLRLVHVGIAVDKVTFGQVILQVPQVYPVNIFPTTSY